MSGNYKQDDKSVGGQDLHDLLFHETPAQQKRREILYLVKKIEANIENASIFEKVIKKLIKKNNILPFVTNIKMPTIQRILELLDLNESDINRGRVYGHIIEYLTKEIYIVYENFNIQTEDLLLLREKPPFEKFPKNSPEDTEPDFIIEIEEKIKEIEKTRRRFTETTLEASRILEIDLVPGWFMQTREFSPEEIPPHSEAQDSQPEALEPALQTREFSLEEETPPHLEDQNSQPVEDQDSQPVEAGDLQPKTLEELSRAFLTNSLQLDRMNSWLLSRSAKLSLNFQLCKYFEPQPLTQPSSTETIPHPQRDPLKDTIEIMNLQGGLRKGMYEKIKKSAEDNIIYSELIEAQTKTFKDEIKKAKKSLIESLTPLKPSEDPEIATVLQTEINNLVYLFTQKSKNMLKQYISDIETMSREIEYKKHMAKAKQKIEINTIKITYSQDEQNLSENVKIAQENLQQKEKRLSKNFSTLISEIEKSERSKIQECIFNTNSLEEQFNKKSSALDADEKEVRLLYSESCELYSNNPHMLQLLEIELEIDLKQLNERREKLETIRNINNEKRQKKLKKDLEELENLRTEMITKNIENLKGLREVHEKFISEMKERESKLKLVFEGLKMQATERKNDKLKKIHKIFKLRTQILNQRFLSSLKELADFCDEKIRTIESRIERLERDAVTIQIPPEILDTLDRVPSTLDRVLPEIIQVPLAPTQVPTTLTQLLATSTRAAIPTLSQMPPLTQVSPAPTKKISDQDCIICPNDPHIKLLW
ncbi:MAG: hypothetical protein LBJ09_00235 [Clostridiales bacterium]|jgi:hypothetical protein|nr:hypothetical protein [Clostridiales bacterium]